MRKTLLIISAAAMLLFGGGRASAKADYKYDTTTGLTITAASEGDLTNVMDYAQKNLTTAMAAKITFSGNFKSSEIANFLALTTKTGDTVSAVITSLELKDATVDEFKAWYAEDFRFNCSFLPKAKKLEKLQYLSLPKIKGKTSYEVPDCKINNGTQTNPVTDWYIFTLVMPNLKELRITDGYTRIGKGAFQSMNELERVHAPLSLEEVSTWAFEYCKKLRVFLCDEEDGVQYRADNFGTFGICRFPKNTKKIRSSAFEDHNFNVIVFPESVDSIGGFSFRQTWTEHLVSDIYLLGNKIPTCEMNAFILWNENITFPKGYASREDYKDNNDRLLPMLHIRPDLSQEELAKITDPSRKYTLGDIYFGNARQWPTADEYKNVSYYMDHDWQGKDFNGQEYDAAHKPYLGWLSLPLVRADAPLSTAEVPYTPDNEWWSICLPCNLNASELKAQFGDDVQLYTLNKVTRNADKHRIFLDFTKKCTSLEAWKPYIIKHGPRTATSGYTTLMKDLLFRNGSEDYVAVQASSTGKTKETGQWWYRFLGNCTGLYHKSGVQSDYVSMERPRYSYYLGSKDGKVSWFYQETDQQRIWKPNTCAVVAFHVTSTNWTEIVNDSYQTTDTPGVTVDDTFRASDGTLLAKSHGEALGDDETTDVMRVEFVTPDRHADGNIYNLNGQLVRANAASTEGLPSGIYVCNGKKIVVK